LDDPKYIEKLAREDHNMVGKNEIPLFIVKDEKAKTDKAQPAGTKARSTKKK
jgi:cell division protein DivIC